MSIFKSGKVESFGAIVTALCGAVYSFVNLQRKLVINEPTNGWGGTVGAAKLRRILTECSTLGVVKVLAPLGCCGFTSTHYALNHNLISSNYSAYVALQSYCNSFAKTCGRCENGCK